MLAYGRIISSGPVTKEQVIFSFAVIIIIGLWYFKNRR